MTASVFADPKYDFAPWPGPPRVQYVVCGVPRSGSNFLATLLHATGNAGFPAEYFHELFTENFARRVGTDDYARVLEFITRHRTSPNGVFGFKAHYEQFLDLGRRLDIARHFPNLKYIRIRRRDVLGQAISYARAIRNGQYTSLGTTNGQADIDDALIEFSINHLLAQEHAWSRYLARRDLPACEVTYEDLADDPAQSLAAVGRFLGIDETLSIRSESLITEKQATETNAQWRRRIAAANRAHEFPRKEDHIVWLQRAPIGDLVRLHTRNAIDRLRRAAVRRAPLVTAE